MRSQRKKNYRCALLSYKQSRASFFSSHLISMSSPELRIIFRAPSQTTLRMTEVWPSADRMGCPARSSRLRSKILSFFSMPPVTIRLPSPEKSHPRTMCWWGNEARISPVYVSHTLLLDVQCIRVLIKRKRARDKESGT